MTISQLLDPIPVTLVFVGFIIVALATYEMDSALAAGGSNDYQASRRVPRT